MQSSSSAEQRERESAAMEDMASQLHEALRLWSLSVGEIIPRSYFLCDFDYDFCLVF